MGYKYCRTSRTYTAGAQGWTIEARVQVGGESRLLAKALVLNGQAVEENYSYEAVKNLVTGTQPHKDAVDEFRAALPILLESSKQPRLASYEHPDVMDSIKAALRPLVKEAEGDKLIWRAAHRWVDDEGALPNHYEMQSLDELCEVHHYEVVHDFNHVAVVRPIFRM